MVYVLSHTGAALMPTQRHGKVRRLLRGGLAHVVRRTPFTIRLDYESTEVTQPVTLGVDAGTTHVCLTERKYMPALDSGNCVSSKPAGDY